ncbi:hypothetical protein [Telmatospirillum sp. J64-1]|uniref:hypothetical protein n=1 Tax=Telmatospirillum sp. J64-1 TaxID=2502183 RepID=UPI00115F4D6D|nr:hypothetical protein [Telmatospirillum sp. J64-1]
MTGKEMLKAAIELNGGEKDGARALQRLAELSGRGVSTLYRLQHADEVDETLAKLIGYFLRDPAINLSLRMKVLGVMRKDDLPLQRDPQFPLAVSEAMAKLVTSMQGALDQAVAHEREIAFGLLAEQRAAADAQIEDLKRALKVAQDRAQSAEAKLQALKEQAQAR